MKSPRSVLGVFLLVFVLVVTYFSTFITALKVATVFVVVVAVLTFAVALWWKIEEQKCFELLKKCMNEDEELIAVHTSDKFPDHTMVLEIDYKGVRRFHPIETISKRSFFIDRYQDLAPEN